MDQPKYENTAYGQYTSIKMNSKKLKFTCELLTLVITLEFVGYIYNIWLT